MISLLPIHRSQHVAVLGGSVDGLTIPIAKYVYDGNVIAMDGDQAVLDELKLEVNRVHLTNVTTLLVDPENLSETEVDTDGVVVVDALHNTTRPAGLFRGIASLLSPGGWLLIADWFATDARGDNGPAKSKRVDPARIERWAADKDMTPITRRTLGVQRYIHVYRKRRPVPQ